jgi:hypothetical protein
MLHLFSAHRQADLCSVTISSICTAYGTELLMFDYLGRNMEEIDEVLESEADNTLLSNIDHKSFSKYLEKTDIRVLKEAIYWQFLPFDCDECDQVIAETEYLRKRKVKIQFLLPDKYANWEEVVSGLSSQSKEIINSTGKRLNLLPVLDLSSLQYTFPDKKLHLSMMVGVTRLDISTRRKISKLIEIFLGSIEPPKITAN